MFYVLPQNFFSSTEYLSISYAVEGGRWKVMLLAVRRGISDKLD